ncbi:MAG: hypothetical protein KF910_01140 [Brevundimonas sp.]|uniref:hypothetical protein n=1 Tax=Brevundimonas sp. TaxID=1871086 RepID=UPI0025BC4C73|nr:hypothetical protein [Brevundimonas sp.]MBX3476192.1 hypothetical protein [Brevundimonas sp.]
MKTFTLALAAATTLAFAAPASAQTAVDRPLTAEETADIQCMAIYSLVAAQGQTEAGALGVFYFLGRLEGRDPAQDWLRRLQQFADGATQADVAPHSERCGQAIMEKAETMQRVGAEMTAQED